MIVMGRISRVKWRHVTGVCILHLSLFLSVQFASSQSSLIDSLEQVLATDTISDKARLDVLRTLISNTISTDKEKMLAYAEDAVLLARRTNHGHMESFGLLYIGIYHDLTGKPRAGIPYLDSAALIAENLNDNRLLISCLNSKSVIYYKLTEHEKGLETNLRMIEVARTDDLFQEYESFALGNIGGIYKQMDELDKSTEYYTLALEAAEKGNAKRPIAIALQNLGNIKTTLGDYKEAESLLMRSLAIKEELGDERSITYSLQALSGLYTTMDQPDKAVEFVTRGLFINRKLNYKYGEALSLSELGKIERNRNNLDIAQAHLVEALGLAEETESSDLVMKLLKELAGLHHDLNKHQEAYQYLTRYNELNAELFKKEKFEALSDMREKYETEQKEQQITLLEKDNQIQRAIRNSVGGGLLITIAFLGVVFMQRNRISREKKRSDELLLNILPEEVAEELKAKGEAEAQLINQVTVLFTDFKGFTSMSEQLTPQELVRDLHECFSAFDHICQKYGIEKIKTIGDAYMAAGGLPSPRSTHAKDVVHAALEMAAFIEKGKDRKMANNHPFFEVRIGVHTGPVVAGIVGVKKFQYDIWGDTVNTASRMESSGEVGKVNISESTYELLKDHSDFAFERRGKIKAKGKGELEMLFVESRK
ncbi:MAG: hypothetical protein EA392_12675 [Cryomorphaceae bacterium]|nr:MAG: hypothetical protein EA392_12675 [Cryomorphaceae bacterium]